MKFKLKGIPNGISDEERAFIDENLQRLTDAIIAWSNRSNKDALEFGDTEVIVTPTELMNAAVECTREWLLEEYGLEIASRFERNSSSAFDDELEIDDNSPEELVSAAYIYQFSAELNSMILDEYLVPLIAATQLHKEWQKRHGGNNGNN